MNLLSSFSLTIVNSRITLLSKRIRQPTNLNLFLIHAISFAKFEKTRFA